MSTCKPKPHIPEHNHPSDQIVSFHIFLILLNPMSSRPWGAPSRWGFPKDAPPEVEKPIITPLCHACYYGNLQTVCENMEDESLDVNLSDRFGRTPLFFACSENHFSVVEKLLKHPNIDVNRKNDDNESFPLDVASNKGYLHVVRELLTSEKLDVNVRYGIEFLTASNLQVNSTKLRLFVSS